MVALMMLMQVVGFSPETVEAIRSRVRSREEMLMGEVGTLSITTETSKRVGSLGYSSASEAPSATRKRLHSSEPEAGEDLPGRLLTHLTLID